MKGIIGLFLILMALIAPGDVRAATFRSGMDATVPAAETVAGTLYVAGDVIDIKGVVEGDLICAGGSVKITGRVMGDILCAANEMTVDADILQDARIIGRTVLLAGDVGKNATVVGQDIRVDGAGIIGELALIGQHLAVMDGSASGMLLVGENASFDGSVRGDLDTFVRSLEIGPESSVSGTVRYPSDAAVTIAPDAAYGAVAMTKELVSPERRRGWEMIGARHGSRPAYPIAGLFWWVAGTLVLTALFPKLVRRFADSLKTPAHSFLAGILFSVLLPFAVLFLVVSIIGIPMLLLLVPILLFLYVLGRVAVAVSVGYYLIRTFREAKADMPQLLGGILGMMVIWFAERIPYVGPWIQIVVGIAGTGAVVLALFFRGRPSGKRK